MKTSFLGALILGAVLLVSGTTQAALSDGLDKIKSSLTSAQFDQVKAALVAEPALTEQGLVLLSQYARDQLSASPKNSAAAMQLVVDFGATLSVMSGRSLTPILEQILAALKAVGPLTCEEVKQNAVVGTIGTSSAMASYRDITDSLENLAQSPSVVAAAPQLFAQVKANNIICDPLKEEEEAQLAQFPGGPTNLQLNIQQILDVPGSDTPPTSPPSPEDFASPN